MFFFFTAFPQQLFNPYKKVSTTMRAIQNIVINQLFNPYKKVSTTILC